MTKDNNRNLYLGGAAATLISLANDMLNSGVLTPEMLAELKGFDFKTYVIIVLVIGLLRKKGVLPPPEIKPAESSE